MFNWLRRRSEPKRPERTAPRAKARSAPTTPAQPQQRDFAPSRPAGADSVLPEVVAEGNTEADWSVWEDSKTAWDSQMQGVMPSDRVYVRDTRPSQIDELDPFSSVRRKRDL